MKRTLRVHNNEDGTADLQVLVHTGSEFQPEIVFSITIDEHDRLHLLEELGGLENLLGEGRSIVTIPYDRDEYGLPPDPDGLL